MNNPYEILGIRPDATDDEVKNAYRELAKKYHPDNYSDNPLSDLAEEKMQEINEAYDAIIRMRRGGEKKENTHNQASGGGRYADIRNLIRLGRVIDAETLLDGVPAPARDAEWYFLKGSVLYKKGWLDDAHNLLPPPPVWNRKTPNTVLLLTVWNNNAAQAVTIPHRSGAVVTRAICVKA